MAIKPVTIGVAGGTGSGKTTVSSALLERAGARDIAYLPHDAYYRDIPFIPRTNVEVLNFDHPDAFETSLMVEHIKQLQQAQHPHPACAAAANNPGGRYSDLRGACPT